MISRGKVRKSRCRQVPTTPICAGVRHIGARRQVSPAIDKIGVTTAARDWTLASSMGVRKNPPRRVGRVGKQEHLQPIIEPIPAGPRKAARYSRVARLHDVLCQAEIGHMRHVVLVYQYVCRLQVAVENSLLMRMSGSASVVRSSPPDQSMLLGVRIFRLSK